MVAYPSPRNWTNNEEPTAQMFNTNLRDPYISFLWNPPRVLVYRSGAQTLPVYTPPSTAPPWTLLTWTHEYFDSDNMFSGGSRLTCQTTGVYEICLHIQWQVYVGPDGGHRYAALEWNNNGGITPCGGNEMAWDSQKVRDGASGAPQTNHICIMSPMNAGDYVEAIAMQTSDATRHVQEVDTQTTFGMLWMGRV